MFEVIANCHFSSTKVTSSTDCTWLIYSFINNHSSTWKCRPVRKHEHYKSSIFSFQQSYVFSLTLCWLHIYQPSRHFRSICPNYFIFLLCVPSWNWWSNQKTFLLSQMYMAICILTSSFLSTIAPKYIIPLQF